VPKPFPAEFRADVIAVVRKGEAPLRQIARDFGISDERRQQQVTRETTCNLGACVQRFRRTTT
jgi:transposase-like protein